MLNICVSNIQFDTFRSLVGKEETEGEREREGEREKERSIVKFAYYYFLSFTMSFVRKWTFFSPCACGHTCICIVLNYVSIDRTLLYYIYLLFRTSFIFVTLYHCHYNDHYQRRGNDLIVTSVGVVNPFSLSLSFYSFEWLDHNDALFDT